MPHTALYRKKRPLTFLDVVGQRHIVRALSNQILAGQISHAYLFCGTRGTGKTSIARIFARAINCEAPDAGNPCNVCNSCTGILAERNLNVVEIDAASNNGVENIRDLREEVKYQPSQGSYKVYIIDEVHMLSTSAFNALLKTLEEPPAHVVFILATTDQQKLPATILSRCQRYDFRRISVADMTATLQRYLDEECVKYENDALDYIAYHSDGAMRDALSLLDQCLTPGGKQLEYAQVMDMLGAVDRGRLFEFTTALAACDSATIMSIINNAMQAGRDASQFTADLVRHFRDVMVVGLMKETKVVDFSAEIADRLRKQSQIVGNGLLMEYIHTFSETLREMRFAPHPRTALEVCALKVCVPRVENTAVYVQASPPPPNVPAPSANNPAKEIPTQVQSNAPRELNSQILDNIVTNWDSLCTKFPNPTRAHCTQCGLENNDGKLELILSSETMRSILKPKEAAIREAIAEKFNLSTPPNLAFIVREGYNKPKASQPPAALSKIPEHEMRQQSIPADWAAASEPEGQQSIPTDWIQTAEPDPLVENGQAYVTESNRPVDDDWAAFGEVVENDSEW